MVYKETTALKKILNTKGRIRVIQGGTSAGKSISILMVLIDMAQASDNKLISCVSETMPHLKRGIIRDFLNIMESHRYFNPNRWNKTDYIYTFESGSKIEFFSADISSKVRGPRRDILFINECNNISYETYTQLAIRTKDIIFLDYNPVSEFWVHEDLIPREQHEFIVLTYKDNESLDKNIVKTIEARKYNKNWWKVYGEGQLGDAEGRIYKGWIQIDDIPEEARIKRKGLDFGYTNDPTALIDIYVWNNAYIWDELLYRKGMSNKDISDVILHSNDALVIADSSEPKSIDEIKSYGVSILPSQKGQGSVLQGVQWVQDQVIYVTKRSVNTWKEYRNYLWLTDKDGKIINEPQDFMNHGLDAGRYGMESLRPVDEDDQLPEEQLFDQSGMY